MQALTRSFGQFVAGLRFEAIPQAAHEVFHTGFADCVGVMLAGAHEPARAGWMRGRSSIH
jgi:2-methylcitrate dehydratase PrpD